MGLLNSNSRAVLGKTFTRAMDSDRTTKSKEIGCRLESEAIEVLNRTCERGFLKPTLTSLMLRLINMKTWPRTYSEKLQTAKGSGSKIIVHLTAFA